MNRPATLAAASIAAAGSILYLAYKIWKGPITESVHRPEFIESPAKNGRDLFDVPYPPTAFPGARDVGSPVGSTRAYEWGPEDGHKILLVHGISTPCVALGDLAWALVRAGCRVCIYDLWGRGYSDSPSLPHDTGLYAMQINMVLVSSPISWTGTESGKFSMIGYSLGGGIAMSYAACNLDLVENIVLLGPGGIVRSQHPTLQILPLRQPQIFLSRYVKRVCELVLCGEDRTGRTDAGNLLTTNTDAPPEVPIAPPSGTLDVESVVRWQIHNHQGYVQSFLSSLAYAPIKEQHEDWKKVGRYISSTNKQSLKSRKIMLFTAETDPYVRIDEIVPDANEVLGEENLHVEYMNGVGHEFPVTRAQEVADRVLTFWRENGLINPKTSSDSYFH